VVHILFGSLRQRFEDVGIRVGTRVRVRERDAASLTLELPAGALAAVDAVHAAFVEVRPPAPDAPFRSVLPSTRHLTVGAFPDRARTGDPTPNTRIA
jgi:hypothetical protein